MNTRAMSELSAPTNRFCLHRLKELWIDRRAGFSTSDSSQSDLVASLGSVSSTLETFKALFPFKVSSQGAGNDVFEAPRLVGEVSPGTANRWVECSSRRLTKAKERPWALASGGRGKPDWPISLTTTRVSL